MKTSGTRSRGPDRAKERAEKQQRWRENESLSSRDISTKLERIAKQAKEVQGVGLYTLAHYIDVAWLREAYRRTRKDGARGVDGQSAEQYGERLEENLASLLERAKSGRWAPPVW